ncbi:MAG: phosphodiester glycosidase family protein [Armatimonas sp.]
MRFLLLCPAALLLLAPPGEPEHYERPLVPGVTLVQEVTPQDNAGGPLTINVVRVAPGTEVRAALGGGKVWALDSTSGRETVSGLAQRTGALVAINAGFFPYLGNPIGLHVEDGDLVTEPQLNRGSLVVTESGQATVAVFQWKGTVSIGEESKMLHGLNRKPGKGNELLLFTPRFFERTLKAPERVEVVLSGAPSPLRPGSKFTAKVESVNESGGETPLAAGTVVLSAGGESATWLKEKATVGAELTIDLAVTTQTGDTLDPTTIRHAVTGAGRLLKNGKSVLNLKAEGMAASFSTTRHPRTAVGVTTDGTVLLVTVDGRQPLVSRGASLPELTAIMQHFGAVEALNLDGGGSSAMSVFGGVVNSPSDPAERAVADMLVVGQTPAPMQELPLPTPSKPLVAQEKYTFALPNDVNPNVAVWTQKGNTGFLDQGGVFTPVRAGKATIRVRVGDTLYTGTFPVKPSATPSLLPKKSDEDEDKAKLKKKGNGGQ